MKKRGKPHERMTLAEFKRRTAKGQSTRPLRSVLDELDQFKPREATGLKTEHQEQVEVIRWANDPANKHYHLSKLLFAIPNGGHRSKKTAGKLKAEGVKSGVPDLFLPVPGGPWHGLFIEMKRAKGGRESAEQTAWISTLRAMNYRVEVCAGAAQAIDIISDYLTHR